MYVCAFSSAPCAYVAHLVRLHQDGFAWSKEVVLMEREERMVKLYWRVLYDDSQKVFQLFDNELEYKQTAVKVRTA